MKKSKKSIKSKLQYKRKLKSKIKVDKQRRGLRDELKRIRPLSEKEQFRLSKALKKIEDATYYGEGLNRTPGGFVKATMVDSDKDTIDVILKYGVAGKESKEQKFELDRSTMEEIGKMARGGNTSKTKYKIGEIVKVSSDNDNEGYDSFRNRPLKITHVATNDKQHPGYDSSMEGMGLYDFVDAKTGKSIGSSLYDYELEYYADGGSMATGGVVPNPEHAWNNYSKTYKEKFLSKYNTDDVVSEYVNKPYDKLLQRMQVQWEDYISKKHRNPSMETGGYTKESGKYQINVHGDKPTDYKIICKIIRQNGKEVQVCYHETNDKKIKGVEVYSGKNYINGSTDVSYSKKYDEVSEVPLKYKSVVSELIEAHHKRFECGGGMAKGGEMNDRMYNFLQEDLEKLEKAISEGDKEEVERFFSYWGQHLKSLETKTNQRVYDFLKEDLEKLEKAISAGDKEEIEKFFSYWNYHLKSLKMTDKELALQSFHSKSSGGSMVTGGELMGATQNGTPKPSGYTLVRFEDGKKTAIVKDEDGNLEVYSKSPNFAGYHLIINGVDYEFVSSGGSMATGGVIGDKRAQEIARNIVKMGKEAGIELPDLKNLAAQGALPGNALEAYEEFKFWVNNGDNPNSLRLPYDDSTKLTDYIKSHFPNKVQRVMSNNYGNDAIRKAFPNYAGGGKTKSDAGHILIKMGIIEQKLNNKGVFLKDFNKNGIASNAAFEGHDIEEYNYTDEKGEMHKLSKEISDLIDEYNYLGGEYYK